MISVAEKNSHRELQFTVRAPLQEVCHAVMAVPGLPTSLMLLSSKFVFLRDFTVRTWAAGEPGCWSVPLYARADASRCASPGVVAVREHPPTFAQLHRVPSVRFCLFSRFRFLAFIWATVLWWPPSLVVANVRSSR